MYLSRNNLVKNQHIYIAFAVLLTATNPAQAVPVEQQMQDVVSHLVGVMDTSAQAAANPKAPNVRMTTCQVKVENTDINTRPSVFLYQEQAMSESLNSPYRQRFLQITPTPDAQKVESVAFRPPNPKTLIGFCNQPEQMRVVKKSDIGESSCRVILQPEAENYKGETPSEGCPTNVRGAVKITNTILLHKTGMDTQDRGFDAAGNLVWGAKERPYQFRWVGKK